MEKSIYDLKLHEGLTVSVLVGKNHSINYNVTRVHGGWIYRNTADTVTSIFVPYTDAPDGTIDNSEQLGNRETVEVSGKSTQDVAESAADASFKEISKMVDSLSEERKAEILKELQKRGH